MKKNIRTEKKRSDDQTVVILEDIRSRFMFFGEKLSSVSDKVNSIEIGQNALSGKVDKLEIGQDAISDKLDNFMKETKDQFMAFGEGQEVLADKVDRMDERLEKVGDNTVEIKHKLSEKVDLEDFQKLEKRFVKLEKIVLARI